MSALTDLYDDAIARGTGHRIAVRELAIRLDVDEPTIGRLLHRARADVSVPAAATNSSGRGRGMRSDRPPASDPLRSSAATTYERRTR